MKIDDVALTLFKWNDIPPTKYAAGSSNSSGESILGLLKIRTDDGVEGYAFLGSATYSADLDCKGLIRFLKPILMGADPLDREQLYQTMWKQNRKVTMRSIGAVDVALYDIAAKAAGLPLYKFLGGFRESIPAYASSAIMNNKEEYAAEALQYKEDGWAAYKIHPPTIWREDIEVCAAVRKSVGDDFDVMLDSTWAYTYDHAIKVGRAIEELGFFWYEDPLADDDLMGCIKLREKLSIPLMATEYSPGGFTNYVPWILNKATDYLRGDVAVKGGITALLKTAHLAEAFGMNYEIHHGGNSLNNWANLHVILAIKNTTYFEVLLPAGAQKYGIIDDLSPNSDGMIMAPQSPGLGASIDFDLIKSKSIETLR
ncbi:MAG: mandelate racemase [Rhodospirillaceae bacterium]|nr:mandelate racemase [Rhodospirillaceae bacterium]